VSWTAGGLNAEIEQSLAGIFAGSGKTPFGPRQSVVVTSVFCAKLRDSKKR